MKICSACDAWCLCVSFRLEASQEMFESSPNVTAIQFATQSAGRDGCSCRHDIVRLAHAAALALSAQPHPEALTPWGSQSAAGVICCQLKSNSSNWPTCAVLLKAGVHLKGGSWPSEVVGPLTTKAVSESTI